MTTLLEEAEKRGGGGRSYHDKWAKVATEAVADAEEEERLERDAAGLALGTDAGPASAAEAADLATNEKLREAKATWARREAEERAQKLELAGETGLVEIDEARLGGALVVDASACEGATIVFAADLKLVKVFLRGCRDCAVELGCGLVTSFVEMSRCERTRLVFKKPLHTVQCDLCDDCAVAWASREVFDAAAPDGPRVYSAACRRLAVDAGGGRTAVADDLDDAVPGAGAPRDEQQFVTQLVGAALLTERVVQGTAKRLVGATQRELDAAGETPESLADEARADAEREKAAGNQAFASREYGQAAVHYTVALDRPFFAGAGRPRAVLLANRSACFLKLGDHARALADGAAAAAMDPGYAKAHFRRGLALHALGRYAEALPCLGTARDLEPRNKQIADAITFAEMRLSRGR